MALELEGRRDTEALHLIAALEEFVVREEIATHGSQRGPRIRTQDINQ